MGIASGMKELTGDIASSHRNRVERVGEIKEEANQASAEAHDLIKGFQNSRHQAGVELRNDLAKETVRRKSEVNKIMQDAQRTIQGCRSERKSTGARLRIELAQSGANNKSDVGLLLNDAQNLIRDFKGFRGKAGDELLKELAEDRADRESEVNKMLSDFHQAQAGERAELREAAEAWQGLSKITQVKMAGVKALPKAKPPISEEKTELPEAIPDLEAKLLAAINEHRNGISLTEVAENLGVVPVVLGRSSKALVKNGKIRKEDKLYFPIVNG